MKNLLLVLSLTVSFSAFAGSNCNHTVYIVDSKPCEETAFKKCETLTTDIQDEENLVKKGYNITLDPSAATLSYQRYLDKDNLNTENDFIAFSNVVYESTIILKDLKNNQSIFIEGEVKGSEDPEYLNEKKALRKMERAIKKSLDKMPRCSNLN